MASGLLARPFATATSRDSSVRRRESGVTHERRGRRVLKELSGNANGFLSASCRCKRSVFSSPVAAMGSRRPSTPLGLATLLVIVASCLTYLNGVAAEWEEADCASHINCSSCLNSTFKNSSCLWLDCKEVNRSRCVNETNESEHCTVHTVHEQCLVTPTNGTTSAPPRNITSIPTPGNATHTTSPKETTTNANTTVTTTAIPGTPSPRKSTFDASSFIGGIVLVLGLQAVIFFLYKFCKSKDQNYHTL